MLRVLSAFFTPDSYATDRSKAVVLILLLFLRGFMVFAGRRVMLSRVLFLDVLFLVLMFFVCLFVCLFVFFNPD